jgi:hypothetical protein
MQIKSFSDFINEAAESAGSVSSVLKYSNPMDSTIAKDSTGGRQNVVAIKANGITRKYKIIGSLLLKSYDLNFKDLEKKPNGDMVFNRYVKGGVDPQTISFNQVADIIKSAAKGASEISPVTGITFYKI